MEWLTWATQHNVEVQTVNTDWWIVFDTQIDMFLDTETKVTASGEVVTSQLVFTDLETNEIIIDLLLNTLPLVWSSTIEFGVILYLSLVNRLVIEIE